MSTSDTVSQTIVTAAFALAAERGTWRGLTLEQIADAADVDLATLFARFPTKGDITRAFADGIDAQLLAETEKEDRGEPIRDRLFDLFMRRFDALEPHHAAIRVIGKELGGGTPADMLFDGCRLLRSIAWTLEAAGIATGGLLGLAKVKVMTALYLGVARTWLQETGDDRTAKTEAALDKALTRAESLANSLPKARRYSSNVEKHPDTPDQSDPAHSTKGNAT